MYNSSIKEDITRLSTMRKELYKEMDLIKTSDPDLARELDDVIEQYKEEIIFLLELSLLLSTNRIKH